MDIDQQFNPIDVRLPNTHITDLRHNHDDRRTHVVEVGYSRTAPDYHLFKCVAESAPPRNEVELLPLDPSTFSPESKGGLGGCSMRKCPGEAVKMSTNHHRAYCKPCAARVRGVTACPWTSLVSCKKRSGLDQEPYNQVCTVCSPSEEENNVPV